jgi:hypothetical protein
LKTTLIFVISNLPVTAPIYVTLLHYPMTNRKGEVVTTAVTNMDLHDISRSCRTYGVKNYFVVTPLEEQHRVVGRILEHWRKDQSKEWHPDRYESMSRVRLVRTFEDVKEAIKARHGELPEVVLTDARPLHLIPGTPPVNTYSEYRSRIQQSTKPVCIVFGTGWGTSDLFYPEVNRILTPIYGPKDDEDTNDTSFGEYNHLSVRSAVAIILDRLLGV